MMAKKKKDKKPIYLVRGSGEWEAWSRELVEYSGMPAPVLIDVALRLWAKRNGFTKEPPKR